MGGHLPEDENGEDDCSKTTDNENNVVAGEAVNENNSVEKRDFTV